MTDKKPATSNSVTPYLALKDAAAAIDFYKYVLDATEEFRMDTPDGKIGHASLRVGDSQIMLAEACPMTQGPTRCSTYVYVSDPDAVFKRAKERGATTTFEPEDMFYGDRVAGFIDPYGQVWSVALHVEDVSDDEVRRRAKDKFANQKKAA